MPRLLWMISTAFTLLWVVYVFGTIFHDPTWGFNHPSEVEIVIQEAIK